MKTITKIVLALGATYALTRGCPDSYRVHPETWTDINDDGKREVVYTNTQPNTRSIPYSGIAAEEVFAVDTTGSTLENGVLLIPNGNRRESLGVIRYRYDTNAPATESERTISVMKTESGLEVIARWPLCDGLINEARAKN